MPAETEQSTAEPLEVLRWYTRARKIPRFVGKAPGGGRYPGGPYTITQAVGAAAVLIAGQQTMSVWGRFGVLPNLAILAVAVAATLFGLKLVKPSGRDPVSALLALMAVTTSNRWGHHGERKIITRTPHAVRHRVNALMGPSPTQPQPDPLPEPVLTPPKSRGVLVESTPGLGNRTVVEQLLAQVRDHDPKARNR